MKVRRKGYEVSETVGEPHVAGSGSAKAYAKVLLGQFRYRKSPPGNPLPSKYRSPGRLRPRRSSEKKVRPHPVREKAPARHSAPRAPPDAPPRRPSSGPRLACRRWTTPSALSSPTTTTSSGPSSATSPEILDAVVRNLGWFRTTFAMAGRTCREAVDRVPSPLSLTEDERKRFRMRCAKPSLGGGRPHALQEITPLAVAVMEGDVEALEWLIQLFDGKGLNWQMASASVSLCWLPGAARSRQPDLRARERVPVGQVDVRRSGWWAPGRASVGASERVPVGPGHVRVRGFGRSTWMCLQWALQNGCPWDENTCKEAASGGHMGVLQWAHGNGCPWNEWTCSGAALGGHLEVLQWARENWCGSGTSTRVTTRRREVTWRCFGGRVRTGARGTRRRARPRRGEAPGGVAMGASEQVPVGRVHVLVRGAQGHLEVLQWGASGRVPVGQGNVRGRGAGRPPEGTAVGASERVPVGQGERARPRRREATWRCCGGRIRTGARGTSGLARGLRKEGLEVLQWAHQNGCPWHEVDVLVGGEGRPPGGCFSGRQNRCL